MTPEQITTLFDLLDSFPKVEDQLMEIFSASLFKEITRAEYGRRTTHLCMDFVKDCILTIKQGVKTDESLTNAYFDVARYQTDIVDAAIEWDTDVRLLGLLLRKRPPPKTPEERLCLMVPIDVTKKREI